MDNNDKISRMENEIKDLKNEVRAVLLDLRGNYRYAGNPLKTPAPPVLNRQITAGEPPPDIRPAIAREEVVRQPSPELHSAELPGTHDAGQKIDAVNIAGLAGWVEESTRRLGRERTGALLDIAEKVGYLPPHIKGILSNIINAEPGGNAGNTAARDYLDSLVRIREKRREALFRLLSV